MGMEGILVGGVILLVLFWIIGKIFIEAFKFLLIAALGVAVVALICGILISPLFLLYAVAAGGFGWYMNSTRSNEESDEESEGRS